MRLHSVELMNYKSIGTDHNEIIIEPNITAIIGKNESGKSNVLSALSGISFINKIQNVFVENNVNRNSDNGKIAYKITLKALPDESQCLREDTTVTITSESYSAVGGIMRYYEENVKEAVNAFYEIVKVNPFKFMVFNASTCGDNCAKYILEIARQQDITINLRHIMRFGTHFKVRVLNEDVIVDNMEQLVLIAAKYV